MGAGAAIKLIINIIIMLVLCINISLAAPEPGVNDAVPAFPEGAPEIMAQSAILAESEHGQVLFEKDAAKPLHISALCKLMTILIAVETGDLGSKVTISRDSVDSQGSALKLVVGEKYSLEELLYGIMLTSANDAARAVAESLAGDEQKFVVKMNEVSGRLLMKNTNFTNATGLYDENQYTNARDIMIFLNYAIRNQVFMKIFSEQVRPWAHTDGKSTVLTSQNKLFWSYDGVDGGKTGYNEKDLQSVVSTASRGNMRLICVVLDSTEANVFKDATLVYNYGFEKYKKSILVKTNEVLDAREFEGRKISLASNEDVYYVHPLGSSFIKDVTMKVDFQPPVLKAKVAGTASYSLEDGTVINVNLFPSEDIAPPEDFISKARKTLIENRNILYLLIFLLALEFILLVSKIARLFRTKQG